MAATATVTPIGARTRGSAPSFAESDLTRLDGELDALWLTHAAQLRQATGLLRRIDHLTGSERERLCEVMEQVGAQVGLTGPWRVIERANGQHHIAYCSRWVERMPAAENEVDWTVLLDTFDGRLIDRLPEARYLGRCVSEMASG